MLLINLVERMWTQVVDLLSRIELFVAMRLLSCLSQTEAKAVRRRAQCLINTMISFKKFLEKVYRVFFDGRRWERILQSKLLIEEVRWSYSNKNCYSPPDNGESRLNDEQPSCSTAMFCLVRLGSLDDRREKLRTSSNFHLPVNIVMVSE